MISREKKIALYSAMMKYRALAGRPHAGVSASWQLAPGLEAAVAAVTADLRRGDSFLTTGSSLASSLIPGTKLKELLVSQDAKGASARNGYVRSGAIAQQFSAALEAAETLNGTKGDGVCVLFCESRAKVDLWRKHLQSASRNNLPLVFARFAPEPAAERKSHTAPQAFAFGVPRIAVDSSDVLAVYRVASEAIARARHRRGPTLIDCVDFNHPDADPIRAMEIHLAKKRILGTALKQKIAAQIQHELNKALR